MKVEISVTKEEAKYVVANYGGREDRDKTWLLGNVAIKLARAIKKMEKETTRRSR